MAHASATCPYCGDELISMSSSELCAFLKRSATVLSLSKKGLELDDVSDAVQRATDTVVTGIEYDSNNDVFHVYQDKDALLNES